VNSIEANEYWNTRHKDHAGIECQSWLFPAESHEKEEMSSESTIKAGSGNERRLGHLDSNPEKGETEL
jgi:hypothetical protein